MARAKKEKVLDKSEISEEIKSSLEFKTTPYR